MICPQSNHFWLFGDSPSVTIIGCMGPVPELIPKLTAKKIKKYLKSNFFWYRMELPIEKWVILG